MTTWISEQPANVFDGVVDDPNTMWCRPDPSSVSPIYIPGRLRTASRPFSTFDIRGVVRIFTIRLLSAF